MLLSDEIHFVVRKLRFYYSNAIGRYLVPYEILINSEITFAEAFSPATR